jgi:hypothetical protein
MTVPFLPFNHKMALKTLNQSTIFRDLKKLKFSLLTNMYIQARIENVITTCIYKKQPFLKTYTLTVYRVIKKEDRKWGYTHLNRGKEK